MVIIMNNKVCNPKIEVPSGMELNDKDYLTHLLMMFKAFEKNMAVVLTEASNKTLYEEYKKLFNDSAKLQRDLYNLMFENGWYILEEANKTKIDSVCQTLTKEFTGLN